MMNLSCLKMKAHEEGEDDRAHEHLGDIRARPIWWGRVQPHLQGGSRCAAGHAPTAGKDNSKGLEWSNDRRHAPDGASQLPARRPPRNAPHDGQEPQVSRPHDRLQTCMRPRSPRFATPRRTSLRCSSSRNAKVRDGAPQVRSDAAGVSATPPPPEGARRQFLQDLGGNRRPNSFRRSGSESHLGLRAQFDDPR